MKIQGTLLHYEDGKFVEDAVQSIRSALVSHLKVTELEIIDIYFGEIFTEYNVVRLYFDVKVSFQDESTKIMMGVVTFNPKPNNQSERLQARIN
ncbi:MAG: hypothetical protein K9L31_01900 [Candidatus Pacebacteria bacterium]|nr:hypothetical protein [Candidatus Paceibacterota bacterium]